MNFTPVFTICTHRANFHDLLAPEWQKDADYTELSIPREHPVEVDSDPQLFDEINDRIRDADAVILLAGMYYNHSTWMQIEGTLGRGHKVPVIPVARWRQAKLPRAIQAFACCDPVPWNSKSVRNAILTHISPQKAAAFLAERDERRRALVQLMARAIADFPVQPAPNPLFAPSLNARSPGSLYSPPSTASIFDSIGARPPRGLLSRVRRTRY